MKALAERCGDLHALFESGSLAYRFLMKTGYADDIEFCIQQNTSSTVPVLEADGRIRSRA